MKSCPHGKRPWPSSFRRVKIPTERKARPRLHTQVAPVWLQAPECRARHEQVWTNRALAIEWLEEAIRSTVPGGVVVCAAWSLAEDVVQVLARRRQDWSSWLHTKRLLATARCRRRDAQGGALKLPSPYLAVEALVPLIPATASRPVTVSEDADWCCTLAVRIPGLGQVCCVVSCAHESLTGQHRVRVPNRLD
jgi:hypothetical protein